MLFTLSLLLFILSLQKRLRQNLVPGKEKRQEQTSQRFQIPQFAAMEFEMTPRLHASLMQSLMPLAQVVKGHPVLFLVNLSSFFWHEVDSSSGLHYT